MESLAENPASVLPALVINFSEICTCSIWALSYACSRPPRPVLQGHGYRGINTIRFIHHFVQAITASRFISVTGGCSQIGRRSNRVWIVGFRSLAHLNTELPKFTFRPLPYAFLYRFSKVDCLFISLHNSSADLLVLDCRHFLDGSERESVRAIQRPLSIAEQPTDSVEDDQHPVSDFQVLSVGRIDCFPSLPGVFSIFHGCDTYLRLSSISL